MITETQAPERYLETFDQFNRRSATQLGWLKALRQEGFARFAETGFPTTHDEDWRFTNVAPIAQTPFLPAGAANVTAEQVDSFGTAKFATQLVFVNGHFSRELSRFGNIPRGVKVNGLAEELTSNAKAVEADLGQYLNFRRDAFAALNTAFTEDGAYVHVPRGTVVEQPIYVLYIAVPGEQPIIENPRNLIVVDENSQAAIVEDYVSLGEGTSFSNTVTELVAGDSAVVSHYMIVRGSSASYNVSTLRLQQGRSSNVATHSLLLG